MSRQHGRTMPALNMSPRRALIVAHDLLATAAAVVASFYIRFEAAGLMERGEKLLIFLPAFIVYAGIIYFRYTRTRQQARAAEANPTLVLGRAADAEVLLRAIESGAVKKTWPVGIL